MFPDPGAWRKVEIGLTGVFVGAVTFYALEIGAYFLGLWR
jgi:hypothetical protein